jgi:putative ATP-binding cassette transporter
MNQQFPQAGPSPAPPGAARNGVLAQLFSLTRALATSRYRSQLGLLAAGIVLVIGANVVGQIRLNVWQGDFYDALEQKQVSAFVHQLWIFLVIAGGLLVLVVTQTWLREMTNVRLREWLTHDLLDQWLAPKRAYMLSFAGEIGENPDQRIHQDSQHLTDLTTSLAIGLLQSSLLLASFVGVLWVLSEQVLFEIGGRSTAIPGYMVWCALAYSAARWSRLMPSGMPARPTCASRSCASTSTPPAFRSTAAKRTSAASWTSRSIG